MSVALCVTIIPLDYERTCTFKTACLVCVSLDIQFAIVIVIVIIRVIVIIIIITMVQYRVKNCDFLLLKIVLYMLFRKFMGYQYLDEICIKFNLC